MQPPAERRPHSSHWGTFTAVVRDGRVEALEPAQGDADPAPFLDSYLDALDSPARVRRPSIRRGWLDGRRGRRGADDFVEVDWNTAISHVAAEIERVRTEHGDRAVFGGSYGWGSAGRFHHAKNLLARFLNLGGGFTDQAQNYSFAAAMTFLPHVLGSASAASGGSSAWSTLQGTTELWVAFGGLPLKNSVVEHGGTSSHDRRARLQAMHAAGTRFVNVSPLRDDIDDELAPQWIAPRPNTDTALMLALTYTLVVERRHDEAFLDRCCDGWPEFERYLLGLDDGVAKSPAWAAAICDIDAGAITALARDMAAHRTLVTVTWSLQRGHHGEMPYWAAITLAAALGQIGLPGGGFGFGYTNTATTGSARSSITVPTVPVRANRAASWIPVARIADMLLNPGGSYDFDGEQRTYPDARLVYWVGGNPFHHHQDLNRLVEAFQRPETIVVHEPWWTATARHADIVLPATTTLERDDIGWSSRDDHIVAMKRAVAPRHDARSDFEIFTALAERLGLGEAYTEGRDEHEWLRYLYGRAAKGTDLPDFDAFWSAGRVAVPRADDETYLAAFRADPDTNRLNTPSGRIQITSELVAAYGYDDCPGHPAWLEPAEWLGAATAFPLHLVSNQPRTRLHGQLDMGRASQAGKIVGREPCRVNPADATARNIADGDVIRIFNGRGACLAGAVLDDDVRPGVIQLSTGAWYDPLEPGVIGSLDKHGNPNVLTADIATSKVSQAPSAQTALVDIERYDGDVPAITAFTPPVTRS